jgi:hypothetical protein
MSQVKRKRVQVVLFLCGSGGYLLAGILGHSAIWYGLAVFNFLTGVAFLVQARRAGSHISKHIR